ncbi:MAG: hypothetical protein HOP21_10725 [Methylotenera sp.]|nr:hypothetical protein [Methylotenera sp.]
MPTVTVNIANPGTPLAGGGTSSVGHMWYSISDGQSRPISNGFAPNEQHHGDPFAPGQIYHDDDSNYLNNDYSTTFEITQEQYDKLKDFGKNPTDYGFDTYYNGLKNSCIDFTWQALKEAGLNPTNTEGDLLPPWNSDELHDLFKDQKNHGLYENPKVIAPSTQTHYDTAKDYIFRKDPLTFDLDGDGIETVGISATNPILFDHDGDGIKNGTGWVQPDDALLVLDRNGNGQVDNGLELFGDNTVLTSGARAGQKAADGFDALADLDTNLDGMVSAADAQFASLRLWRDLNQDGISQSGELFSLSSQGIASINVASTAQSVTLRNGNELADIGSFTRVDGSAGALGNVTGKLGDVNLNADTFHRHFPDTLNTASVQHLPDMQGSGAVRDLREAATQSASLQNLLTQYSAATTRAEQMALIDNLLDAWADTSGFAESYDDRVEGMGMAGADGSLIPYGVAYAGFGNTVRNYAIGTTQNQIPSNTRDVDDVTLSASYRQLVAEWTQKIHILEAFNGNYFFGLPNNPTDGAKTGLTLGGGGSGGTMGMITEMPIVIRYNVTQLNLLQQSYDALKESVYDALLLQTRFKPLLDKINLVIDNTGIHLDFTQLHSYFESSINQNAASGLMDLIDFNRVTKTMLVGSGWDGEMLLLDHINNLAMSPELQAIYNQLHFTVGDDSNNTITGGIADEVLVGKEGNDTIYGKEGNDIIYGGAGDDVIYGFNTNRSENDTATDMLIGGKGNDTIYGTAGATTYIYHKGDGADIIYPKGAGTTNLALQNATDTLRLGAGITTQDVKLAHVGNDLIIRFTNAGDEIKIVGYFNGGTYSNRLATIEFADGTVWKHGSTEMLTFYGTSGDDVVYGDNASLLTASTTGGLISTYPLNNDVLYGLEGNDTLEGKNGVDTLYGGAGDDILYGFSINSSHLETTADILVGGTGNDKLYGTAGANTYIYNKGDGADIIYPNGGYSISGQAPLDKLVLREIMPQEAKLSRIGSDMVINFDNVGDQIVIKGWFSNGISNRLTTIEFADGSVWNHGSTEMLTIYGSSSNDTVIGDDTTIQIPNGTGGTKAFSPLNDDMLYGLEGNDTLQGKNGVDTLYGGAGDDILYGFSIYSSHLETTDDVLVGGTGNDKLYGTAGANTFIYNKGDGADIIYTTGGSSINSEGVVVDKLVLGAGISASDITILRSSNDLILQFSNVGDQITIKNWHTNVSQQLASIQLADGATIQFSNEFGTNNADFMIGTANSDAIYGLGGNDVLHGGAGNDALEGGEGYDVFSFNTTLSATSNVDWITDFSVADDTIQLSKTIFTTVGAVGNLTVAAFYIGTTAHDADDRVIYNSTTGDLYYDKDGTGSLSAVKFAHIDANLSLTASDFSIAI